MSTSARRCRNRRANLICPDGWGDLLTGTPNLTLSLQAWQEAVTKKVIIDAWDKTGLETIEGGSNPERLFAAVKRASPYKKEAIAETDEDKAFFEKAMAAPLPCPLKNDFRREVPEQDENAPGLKPHQVELIRLRKELMLPEVYRKSTDFKAALREVTNQVQPPKKRKKTAEETAETRMRYHAQFIDAQVRIIPESPPHHNPKNISTKTTLKKHFIGP